MLLSIGYSACHWCHVMAHESFEDEEIARLMNENFVNIKVDREERPDLDQIYMNAVQMMTHHGGWPMTVFLTPDGVPFYGGTYFPPQDRYNMPGFPRVLISVAEAYRERPQEIAETGTSLARRSFAVWARAAVLTIRSKKSCSTAAYVGIIRNYDSQHGGFGGAPKFPPSMTLGVSAAYLRAHRKQRSPRDGRLTRAERWPRAASTISSAAAFIVTRPTRAGSCRTSRRCSTTMPCSRGSIFITSR